MVKRRTAFFFALTLFVSTASFAGYTDKDIHDTGEGHTYKHPNQRSYTGPFDYAPASAAEPAAPRETGKCNEFTFDARKSFDVDRDKLSVRWDFGDGTSSDKPVVTKVYEKAGTYDVSLTVRDSSGQECDTSTARTTVEANFPPRAVAGEPKTACFGDAVTFDASASEVSATGAKYVWDFGDGHSAEGESVSHEYEKPGNYRVRLLIDDGKGTECSTAADSTTVSVFERADVRLEGPEGLCEGQTASFNAVGSGGVSSYRWDFGDGTTWEGGSRASHKYAKPGNYTVRVTADNGRGTECSTAGDSVNVRVHGRPVANAGDNLACCVGEETTFDASKSSSPAGSTLTYHWDFGDGSSAEGEQVTHVYRKSGNYRVVLTVKDDSGSACDTATDSFVAVVNAKPEAVIQVR